MFSHISCLYFSFVSQSCTGVLKEYRVQCLVLQDAHELFQVLTQTLDEETSRYPSVVSLFDVKTLQVTVTHLSGLAFLSHTSVLT